MNTKGFYLLCFLMGVLITLLMAVLHYSVVPPAHATTSWKSERSFAVSSPIVDVEGQGVLWIVDPEKKVIACYGNDRGVGLRLIGVRKIEYDMKMLELNDITRGAYSVKKLRAQHKRAAGGGK